MKKKLLGLASLLCATSLCVSGGVALLNDNSQSVVAETTETTNSVHTWSTAEGMSFTAGELWQMDQMPTVVPRTIDFCLNVNNVTGNKMIFSNFPTGTVNAYFAVRYVKKSDATNGYLSVFYTVKGNSSSKGCDFTTVSVLANEGYHNYSIVLGDESGSIYVDGVCKETKAYISKKTFAETFTELPGGYNYCVGGDQRNNNTAFVDDGQIKWISAYSDIRTAEEVVASQTSVDGADENLLFAYDLAEAKANGSKIAKNKGTVNNPLVSSKADVWETPVCTDIADYDGAEDYAFGVTGTSIGRWETTYDLQQNIDTDSIGVEFRFKTSSEEVNAAYGKYKAVKESAATPSTPAYADDILWVQLGTRIFQMDYHMQNKNVRWGSRSVHDGVWSSANPYIYATGKTQGGYNAYAFDLDTEYVIKAMRIKHQWKDTYQYAIYMAPVNADGSAGTETLVWKFEDNTTVIPTHTGKHYNRIAAFPLHVANGANYSYTATISSNKYVGIKTTVDDVETVEKVNRGSNFTLADLTNGTTICAGWSKGAELYSAEDFLTAGTVLENVQTPASYRALTMTLEADKAASIRFRQRTVDGEKLPLEISLKWNVKANDTSSLGYYFGGIKFGYVITAENGKTSGDVQVYNITDGFTKPYEYGVVQSNIGEASYEMKFTCQAYVELNGVKYYTVSADMENDGRSVDIVADRAASDLKSVETNGEYVHPDYNVAYSNAIKNADGEVIGYHYLTQVEYDLVATAGAVVTEPSVEENA